MEKEAIKTRYDTGIYLVFFGTLLSIPIYLTARDIESDTYAPGGATGLARLGDKLFFPIASALGTTGVLILFSGVIGFGLYLLLRAWKASKEDKEIAERQMRIERARKARNQNSSQR